jgi:serine/threonine protein kinase/tetratricopeptide (TPR) repeat protein
MTFEGQTQEPPGDAPTTARRPDHLHPAQIGRYRILETLGEGGMGTVYKAEQRTPIKRIVALKVVKPGFDSQEVAARFESERQALARMDHPHVAKVLDAGVDSATGRPYFVMEYVPGHPITDFCDTNRLSIPRRLELFLQVCEAIGHAHQKMIIHRDIKASNVLAWMNDAKPMVKVIDFGVAKALLAGDRLTDRTFNTFRGQAVGTYDSMSPEQAAGSPDVDTRSDVYSLGVLLYELLTGTKPFDRKVLASAADEEVRRIIREVEPPRPSTRVTMLGDTMTRIASARQARADELARVLKGELEWIPLKAMRKERDRRYTSPQQLAEDVQNYLNGRPLLAGPESRAYALRKFVQRHRAAVLTTSAIVVFAAAGVSLYIRDIRSAQKQTAAALQQANQQTAIATAVNQFQSDMLASADPFGLLGERVTVLEATQAALKQIDAGKLKDQPLVEAAVRATIASTFQSLGRYDQAETNARRSLELRRRVLAEDHKEVAESLNVLAVILYSQAKFDQAEPLYRQAIEIQRNVLPAPAAPLATTLNNLAVLLKERRAVREAEAMCREALEINLRALPADDPVTADCLSNLAAILQDQGKLDEAEKYYRQALEMRRTSLPPGHPALSNSLSSLAMLTRDQGKLKEAEKLFAEAVQITRDALPAAHPSLAIYLGNLADTLRADNRNADAEPLYREAVEINRKALSADHPDLAQSLHTLGSVIRWQGRLEEAMPYYEESVRIARKSQPVHRNTAVYINNMGRLLHAMKRLDEVEAYYRESLEMRRKLFRAPNPEIAQSLRNLGTLADDQNKPAQAEALLREALQMYRDSIGMGEAPTKECAGLLATLLDKSGRQSDAQAVRDEYRLNSPTTRAATTAP